MSGRYFVYDCEVFCEDWLFVFKDVETGEYVEIWNSRPELKQVVDDNADALFFSFNGSHYDQWILKSILAGCDETQVKEVNDWIILTDRQPWEMPYLEGVFIGFNDVDLMKDVQLGTSLKSFEGHSGMDIRESSVAFDIDRALTAREREEVAEYCRHDVDATHELLKLRRDYLETKAHLGERSGIPLNKALALTNAKLTAKMLKAERQEHDDERAYTIPDNLLKEWVPQEAFDFFAAMGDESVPDEELWKRKLELVVGGCPVTLAFGGIHGALPKYRVEASDNLLVLNDDVGSYYPSLMIRNGYTSRNMPTPKVFEDVYNERMAAKAAGDKQTANSLKLVVNTTYGATLNQYNDLNDPLMARSVCVSGQLYLLELACHAVATVPDLTLVQLNTDGILVTIPPRSKPEWDALLREWQERTGFNLEEDVIERLWQKDVNNYSMRTTDGHEKVKGGYLVRGHSTAGAFKINNNATVIADALKAYLLDGVPVRETIEACDDPSKFQLIAKASGKYSRVYQIINDEQIDMQKCNRVFACADETLGQLYKVKVADGSVAKIESLPEHCLVSNEGMCRIEQIDKEWYVALAEKRAADFEPEERKDMATAKKTETVDYSTMNVYQKLAIARAKFAEANPKMSGKNRHLEFEYYELKDLTPVQTRIFAEVGLVEIFDEVYSPASTVSYMDETKRETEPAHYAVSTIVNADNPAETITFTTLWSELKPIISQKTGTESQNALQRHGSEQTYLRRYNKLKVLDASEPDENESNSGAVVSSAKPAAAAKPAPAKAAKPATATERKAAAAKIANADGPAPKMQVNALLKVIKTMSEQYGSTHPEVKAKIAEISAETDKLKNITKKQCEKAITDLGDIKAEIEKGGE